VVLNSDFFLLIICPHLLVLYTKQFLEIKLFTFNYHETNLRERLTRYQCVIEECHMKFSSKMIIFIKLIYSI